MQTAPPLSFDSIFMEDPQFAETSEKSIFLFLFFRVIVKIYRELTVFSIKMTITRKIKIEKILNLTFLSIQPIPNLHVSLKKNDFDACVAMQAILECR